MDESNIGRQEMNILLKKILSGLHRHNDCDNFALAVYGLNKNIHYDALVIAPSWKPEKVFLQCEAQINLMRQGPYYAGYEIEVEGRKIGYIQTAACAGNVVDCVLSVLSELSTPKIFFIGAVGALKEDIQIGDIIVPKVSIAGDGSSLYLYDRVDTEHFRNRLIQDAKINASLIEAGKKLGVKIEEKVVYSTDSIVCEYLHLQDILSLGCDAIEMETAAFLRCMELLNKKADVLLCVSDNSATGNSLVGRNDEDSEKFHRAREQYFAELILARIRE
jgi:purine-nucleoside phosphorylase